MKIAVLGPSSEALHMTQDLLRLGASVRLFWRSALESPIEQEFFAQDVLIPAPFKSVTKRFLIAGETPKARSRFADLFRVSYEVNPVERVETIQNEQPEVFEKLSSEFMDSLKSRLELFEDFDVVIDATGPLLVRNIGPGGPCVGESRFRDGSLYFLDTLSELTQKLSHHELALVGDGFVAASALKQLAAWWRQSKSRIFIITNQGSPFEHYLQKSRDRELHDFLSEARHEHEQEMAQYRIELAAWDELDDFVKVKKVKPAEPIPRLVFFSAHLVTAADQLIDKSRTFLTLETSPWNEAQVQVENSQIDIKTIGVDFVIGACGHRRDHSRFYGLDLRLSLDGKRGGDDKGVHPETGFYTLQTSAQREAILQNLLTLFSPKESSQ